MAFTHAVAIGGTFLYVDFPARSFQKAINLSYISFQGTATTVGGSMKQWLDAA